MAHVKDQGRAADLLAALRGSVAGTIASVGFEETLWLVLIEDRRRVGSMRECILEGFALGTT